MTISLWRYSHLALAVSCFLFLTLASATGIILSVDAVQNKNAAVQSRNLDQITLAQAIPVLQHQYMEITELKVKGRNVTIKAIDNDGNDINASINPASGKVLGPPARRTPFIESVTSLHRSLFLHETGRIFMGINAFILFLIALSGILLLIQRQQGLMRFFSKIVKDYFAQYYHVVFSRLMLIPILILSLTGTFMCLHRFHVFNEKGPVRMVSKTSGDISGAGPGDPSRFRLFRTTPFSEVKSISFPFSEDPEEHYTLTLQDKELQNACKWLPAAQLATIC